MASTIEATSLEKRLQLRMVILYILVAILYLVFLIDALITTRLFYAPQCNQDVEQPTIHFDSVRTGDGKASLYEEDIKAEDSKRQYSDDDSWMDGDQDDEEVLHRYKRQSRRNRRRRQQYKQPGYSGPGVDFYDKPQTKQEGDDFVWLTSYSRIPMEVLEEYCVSVKEHCPPGDKGSQGAPGSPGFSGPKGDRGDRGLPGEMGLRGPQGFLGVVGPIGPKGEVGYSGKPGLDGRDGIPGEPGLDGVPGRDGVDGIPGRDGIPGTHGTPGRSGHNGTNGIPGSPGPMGPVGPPGPRGMTGPRGKRGAPGIPGEDGKPGVKAWHVNGTKTDILLVPPSINEKEQKSMLIVDEGHNVRMRCIAAGYPVPNITWVRGGSLTVSSRYLHQSSVPDMLDIYGVTRDKAGLYRCIANNGIPPKDTMDVKLEVTFPPLIKIKNRNVGTVNGSYAVLECLIEAYPPPLSHWYHENDKRVEPSRKYLLVQKEEGYTTTMTLNITYIEPADYGQYKCVSKNEKGKTQSVFTVFESDPALLPPTPIEDPVYEIYGQPPPIPLEETDCESCKMKCGSSQAPCPGGPLHSNEVRSVYVPQTLTLQLPKPRQENCMIHQLGKPVLQRFTDQERGSWYQDAYPPRDDDPKYYATFMSDKQYIYEYANREDFRNDQFNTKHELHFEYDGNAHVVYNGSFYYHEARTNVIIKQDIAQNRTSAGVIHDLGKKLYLYASEQSFLDVTADENGLWVIYPSMYTNSTVIRKLDPFSMKTDYIWNITFPSRSVGDMFIACGVLYAVNNVTDPTTQINFAFDLYQNKQLDVDITFANPFRMNSMITYNPRLKKILSWDKGNQLLYPLLFGTIDMGQPEER